MAIMIAGGLPPRVAGWALEPHLPLRQTPTRTEALSTAPKVQPSGQGASTSTVPEVLRITARDYYKALPPQRFPN
jgi:hypothetical protein